MTSNVKADKLTGKLIITLLMAVAIYTSGAVLSNVPIAVKASPLAEISGVSSSLILEPSQAIYPASEVNNLMLTAGISRELMEALDGLLTVEELDIVPVGAGLDLMLEDSMDEVAEVEPLEAYECLGEFKTTYYCCERYRHICGTGSGITATGTEVTPNRTIAVDPKVIPLGSEVLVDFGNGDVRTYVAEDTGGLVKGRHIDIAVATHDEALHSCNGTVTVYLAPKG